MNKFEQTQQWYSGQSVADYLDAFFKKRGWDIYPTTPEEERGQCLGDRHYIKGETHWYIEYKSGLQTAQTGNIFLETVSVDAVGKAGWLYTCKADYIFYATLLNGCILVMIPNNLRAVAEDLRKQFRETKTSKGQNKGYDTHGLIVPLDYAKKHLTIQVIDVEVRRAA